MTQKSIEPVRAYICKQEAASSPYFKSRQRKSLINLFETSPSIYIN